MDIAYTTQHATARMRQRGIPAELLNLLMRFGDERHDGHGAWVMGFTKRARLRLRRELGAKTFARWESRLNVYAVISDDETLVTVGHRLQRRSGRHCGITRGALHG
jgi:hypothetical protein